MEDRFIETIHHAESPEEPFVVSYITPASQQRRNNGSTSGKTTKKSPAFKRQGFSVSIF